MSINDSNNTKTVLDRSIEILDNMRNTKLMFIATKEEIQAMDAILLLSKNIQNGEIKIYEDAR